MPLGISGSRGHGREKFHNSVIQFGTDLSSELHIWVHGIWLAGECHVKVPKDFLCNMSMCWCIMPVSVLLWLFSNVFRALAVTGHLPSNEKLFPLNLREAKAFSCGLNCMISLNPLALAPHTMTAYN